MIRDLLFYIEKNFPKKKYLNILGYNLSVTKLNGLSPNFLLKYHQHKSFFYHQIKLYITKFNKFSPNKLIFESPKILNSHQIN